MVVVRLFAQTLGVPHSFAVGVAIAVPASAGFPIVKTGVVNVATGHKVGAGDDGDKIIEQN